MIQIYLFRPIAKFNLRNNIHGIVNSYRQFRVSKTKGEKRSSRCMKPGGGMLYTQTKGVSIHQNYLHHII